MPLFGKHTKSAELGKMAQSLGTGALAALTTKGSGKTLTLNQEVLLREEKRVVVALLGWIDLVLLLQEWDQKVIWII